MKTSTKVILGVYGAFVGAWLAGSAYFLANGRDEELEEGLIPVEEPLPREENAYYLFPKLHEFHQTNYNFSIANDFVNGWTNSPAILAEVSELVDAHSNLFACARQIVACRGYQVPEGESKMAAIGPLVSHPTARLYQMKARCEALRGDRKAAQATIDELIEFGRFVRRTGSVVGYLIGVGYIGMAMGQGVRSPIAAPEDCAWRKHLVEVLQEQEESSVGLICAVEGELAFAQQHFEDIQTNAVITTNYLLRDGLDGFGWLTRNSWRDGALSIGSGVRIDWGRVDRSCLAAVLACCPGYSRYALKPNAILNEMGRRCRQFAEKISEATFDREYAKEMEPERGQMMPFRENWLAGRLMWDMRSLYRNHYKIVFCGRASRLPLAFEDFRSAKGRYPTELAELVPDCIAAVPLDSFDEQPIRYNAEHGYFWTPGPDGTFDVKVDFDADGYPRWKNRNYHFVELLDMTKRNRPPSTYCNMSRRKNPKRAKGIIRVRVY